jgi:glycosyltransferase involved in cell wall biosynthesis
MTKILVFYTLNNRAIALETEILEIHRRGFEIELLTTSERGPLHELLESEGVRTHAHPLSSRWSLVYYARQIWYLAGFCRKHQITTVFSNLQRANFVAVFAQFLCGTRFVIFRHHFDFVFPGDDIHLKRSRKERVFDMAINRLARRIVVPSRGVYDGMQALEAVEMSKVVLLPYIYDFAQYKKPDGAVVSSIRSRSPARLTLLMSSRLVPSKRHALVFPLIRDLVQEGLDLRLLALGEGPERATLEEFIRMHGLDERIVMLGYRTNPIDYMAASDLLIHPSISEASTNVVKEMALLGKTAIVCRGVGDFDDYLEHGRNAFLVPRSTDGSDIAAILREVHATPEELENLGQALRTTVLERFRTKPEAVDRYLALAEDD